MTAPRPSPPGALLVDFGGVLTSSVFDAFAAFSSGAGAAPDLVARLLATDEESSRLLVEHESGRLDDEAFELGLAARLRAHGVDDPGAGLLQRLTATLVADEAMIAAVKRLRAAGIPTAIVSNSLGRHSYEGYDLLDIADEVVLSGDVGVRKPSRRIFQIACERLGVEPEESVLVDDVERNLSGAARLGIRGVLHVEADRTIDELSALFGIDLRTPAPEPRPGGLTR